MNRLQRRKLKRQMEGQQIFLPKGNENIDRSKAQYCWLHKLQLDDIDHPTIRDKKLIESVRLIPFKSKDKYGIVTLGRSCKRCGNQIIVDSSLNPKDNMSILETDISKVPEVL